MDQSRGRWRDEKSGQHRVIAVELPQQLGFACSQPQLVKQDSLLDGDMSQQATAKLGVVRLVDFTVGPDAFGEQHVETLVVPGQ